jgi:ABC-type amino acid transport substrate-binding protein
MAVSYAFAGPSDYILWYRNYDSPAIRSLVELALDETPEYGPYQLVRSEELSQGRVLRELSQAKSHLVDIANVATSPEREERLTAIPVPVDGGLLGFRVCVIRSENLHRFNNIHTLDELKSSGIRIGQGSHWPDVQILDSNGIDVVTHPRYEILFNMLRNNRFDCFARGVSEVLYDLEIENDPDLIMEPSLLLAYPMPSFFFVSSQNTEMAQRLQLGMERAIHDGEFAKFLKKYYERPVELLSLGSRNIIELDNPFLSEDSRETGRRALEDLRRRLDNLSTKP